MDHLQQGQGQGHMRNCGDYSQLGCSPGQKHRQAQPRFLTHSLPSQQPPPLCLMPHLHSLSFASTQESLKGKAVNLSLRCFKELWSKAFDDHSLFCSYSLGGHTRFLEGTHQSWGPHTASTLLSISHEALQNIIPRRLPCLG